MNSEEGNVNLEDDNITSEDGIANSDDIANLEDDNAKPEDDSANSEDDNITSEDDNVNSEDDNATSGDGMPRNMGELRILLDYIRRNPEEFDLEDVKILKEVFLNWMNDEEDISSEEFKMYGQFLAAKDAIRGTSDTEDDESEEEDNSESVTESEEE